MRGLAQSKTSRNRVAGLVKSFLICGRRCGRVSVLVGGVRTFKRPHSRIGSKHKGLGMPLFDNLNRSSKFSVFSFKLGTEIR